MSKFIFVLVLVYCMGCGGGVVTENRGQVLRDVGTAFCEQAVTCGFETSVSSCTSDFLTSACTQSDCTIDVTYDTSELDSCIDDIYSLTCSELAQLQLPASCITIDFDQP